MSKGKKHKNKKSSSSKKHQSSNSNSSSNHREEKQKNDTRKGKQKKGGSGSKCKTTNDENQSNNYQNISGDADFRKLLEGNDSKTINEMEEDGNCLFRSLSDQLHGDYGRKHDVIRSQICDYLKDQEEYFKSFVVLDDEDDADDYSDEHASSYEEYIDRMKQEGEWGGNPELVAAAQLFCRNITVFSTGGAFSIDSGHEKNKGPDLMLSYHENSHYNSVKDNNVDQKTQTVSSSSRNKSTKSRSKSSSPPHENIDAKKHSKKMKQKRNELCPCGSGMKYKYCCLENDKRDRKLQKLRERNEIIDPNLKEVQAMKTKKDDHSTKLVGCFKVLQI